MVNSLHACGRFWRFAFCLIFIGIAAAPVVAQQQVNADVEFSRISQTDPHPITYLWNGKDDPVTEPGSHYYVFFYTGTINPDARVPIEPDVKRIAVTQEEWEANRKWIIAKLELYYQITGNMMPTALKELGGQTAGESGTAGGANLPSAAGIGGLSTQSQPGMQPGQNGNAELPMDNNGQGTTGGYMGENQGQNPAGAPPMPGMPGMMPGMPGMMPGMPGMMPGMPGMMPGMPGMMPGMPGGMARGMGGGMGGDISASPRAMAEWTFYYDQLVLWQYYCARQLLHNKEDEVLEASQSSMSQSTGESSNENSTREGVNMVDLASAVAPGEAGRETLRYIQEQTNPRGMSNGAGMGMGAMGGMGNMGGMGMMPGMPGGGMMMPGMGMGGGMGMGSMRSSNVSGEAGADLRELFEPLQDYMDSNGGTEYPKSSLKWREKFQKVADKQEQDLYKNFIEMVNRIDQRMNDQDRYNQWIDARRKDLSTFADNWRKVEEGETFVIDKNTYLVTKDPIENVPRNTVNVTKREQLTPQDLLNEDGSLKQPKED